MKKLCAFCLLFLLFARSLLGTLTASGEVSFETFTAENTGHMRTSYGVGTAIRTSNPTFGRKLFGLKNNSESLSLTYTPFGPSCFTGDLRLSSHLGIVEGLALKKIKNDNLSLM